MRAFVGVHAYQDARMLCRAFASMSHHHTYYALSRVCVYVTSSYILCSVARLRLSLPLCDYDQVWCARLCCALVCICYVSATVVGLSSRMSRMEAQQLMHASEEDALQASGHLIEARTHARGHNCNQALSRCMHLVPLLISCVAMPSARL